MFRIIPTKYSILILHIHLENDTQEVQLSYTIGSKLGPTEPNEATHGYTGKYRVMLCHVGQTNFMLITHSKYILKISLQGTLKLVQIYLPGVGWLSWGFDKSKTKNLYNICLITNTLLKYCLDYA